MSNNQNQDVEINKYINSLFKDYRILIYLLITAILFSFIFTFVINNYFNQDKYYTYIKIKPNEFKKIENFFQQSSMNKNLITFLNDNSSLGIKTFFGENSLLDTKENLNYNSNDKTYYYFRQFNNLVSRPSLQTKIKSQLLNRNLILQKNLNDLEIRVDHKFSENQSNMLKMNKDFSLIEIWSTDNKTSEIFINEMLENSLNELRVIVNDEIQFFNQPIINLINYMIDSLENDKIIYEKYFTENQNDKNISSAKIERLKFVKLKIREIITANIDTFSIEKNLFFNKIQTVKQKKINLSLTYNFVYAIIISFLLYLFIIYIKLLLKNKTIRI